MLSVLCSHTGTARTERRTSQKAEAAVHYDHCGFTKGKLVWTVLGITICAGVPFQCLINVVSRLSRTNS